GIEEAGPGDLTFVANTRYAARLSATRASAVILTPDLETPLPSLLSANPYHLYARAVSVLHPPQRPPAGVHPLAAVDPTAVLGEGVHVGPFAVVGARTRIGDGTILHAQVVVYADVQIGRDCLIHSGVQIREGCRLGDRVIVQNGAILGADGF